MWKTQNIHYKKGFCFFLRAQILIYSLSLLFAKSGSAWHWQLSFCFVTYFLFLKKLSIEKKNINLVEKKGSMVFIQLTSIVIFAKKEGSSTAKMATHESSFAAKSHFRHFTAYCYTRVGVRRTYLAMNFFITYFLTYDGCMKSLVDDLNRLLYTV